MRSQHSGMPKALTKQKELTLYQDLQKAGVEFDYQKHIPFRACGLNSETRCAYVDFVITKPWGYILLECDEDQHRSYDPSCDVRRDFDIVASVALGSGQKLLIIHFNPDPYRISGRRRTETKKDRMQRLLALLDHEPDAFERVFLCYDQDEWGHITPSCCLLGCRCKTGVESGVIASCSRRTKSSLCTEATSGCSNKLPMH